MLSRTPLDILLLILRLLTIKDAVALFATCRSLCLAECRAFWLYANIDMDLLPCALGRPSIDYRTLPTPLLRSRVMKAWSIHAAWRENLLEPRRVRVIPAEWETSHFVRIPWTRAIVVLVDHDLFLSDWSSGARVPVPLSQDRTLLTLSMQVFWTDSENGWVLVVHSLGLAKLWAHLQLFAVDPVHMSVSFLTSVVIPHSVAGIDLRGDHLAVMGHTIQPQSCLIRSFRLMFSPKCYVRVRAVIRMKTPLIYGETSFAIVDDRRFLLVDPAGLAIYRLSTAALQSPGACIPCLRSVWTHEYSDPDVLSSPSLGPILTRSDGALSVSICSGVYLRCVLMTPGRPHLYTVTKKRLVSQVPAQFDVSTGFRIGVYRRPYTSAETFSIFNTSSVVSEKGSLHPFFYEHDNPPNAKGRVVFSPRGNDTLKYLTLQVDEEQGRLMFIVRSYAKRSAKIIVVELV
ncbi:hypothetical protein C8R47DRAFT_1209146 [Mycena vitilis]|nr:hypothetical protein C8R47DRAFT_1209146 [Mycena vitilis]